MKTIIINKSKFGIFLKQYTNFFKYRTSLSRFHSIVKYTTCSCKVCGKKFGRRKKTFFNNKIQNVKNLTNFKFNIEKKEYRKIKLQELRLEYSLGELKKIDTSICKGNNWCSVFNFYGEDRYDFIRILINVIEYEMECYMKDLEDSFKQTIKSKKVDI